MKQPGHCTLCDKPVFQISDGKITHPLPDAWRVRFLLSDETTADMTFCVDCLPDIPESHELIWIKVLERFDFEESQRTEKPSEALAEFLSHIKTVSINREVGRMLWSAV